LTIPGDQAFLAHQDLIPYMLGIGPVGYNKQLAIVLYLVILRACMSSGHPRLSNS
jgi:hypothetical protein